MHSRGKKIEILVPSVQVLTTRL